MAKKLWIVEITLTEPIYAESADEARRIIDSERVFSEALGNVFPKDDADVYALGGDKTMDGCIPWGEENDRTVEQIRDEADA